MDAVRPCPLSLQDLSREELLEFASRVAPLHRQRDLWWARWQVAILKAEAAGREPIAAIDRCSAAFAAYKAAQPGRAQDRAWRAYRDAEAQQSIARRASSRADAAESRAYAALAACEE